LKYIIFCFLIGFFKFDAAVAFPQMIKHGYSNCVICHVSPSGGGVLNSYGRNSIIDLVSSTSLPGEEKVLYGAFNLPEWLLFGGDFRALQFYQNSGSLNFTKGFVMQDDLEASVILGKFTFDATLGQQQDHSLSPTQRSFYSRRYYALYQANDNLNFRAGRYLNPFGINTPDHIISTKAGLNWDEGTESDNVEVDWMSQNVSVYLAGILGKSEDPGAQIEKGVTVNASTFLSDKYKVGGSYFKGTNDKATRQVVGPYGILGFSKALSLLTETDFVSATTTDTLQNTKGIADYQKLDYEALKGFHVFVTGEYLQTNFDDALTIARTYGLGLNYFPRPHLEFLIAWDKQAIAAMPYGFYDFVYLMFHYYL
jgi:hypothetical protein